MTLVVSFETFPARGELAARRLADEVASMVRLNPRYVAVTCGAGGGGGEGTERALADLRACHADLPLAGHLTCGVGTRGAVVAQARRYEASGARWVLALRGDGRAGPGTPWAPQPHGFADAPSMIAALRERTALRIAVAGYPEPHPDSRGERADLDHLRRKVDAGAEMIVTQFFLDNAPFLRFVERCRGTGIDVPIVPGIMPIHDFDRVASFARRCGAHVPPRLAERFAKAKARGAARDLALAVCAGQCDALRDEGVRALHFYTMNRADLSVGVCEALGVAGAAGDPGGLEATAARA